MKKRTVIIGGGLSGLACATRLEKENHEYIIIEKSSRLGGRVGSIYEDGYIFDVGFQVYNTAYSTTNSLLDLGELDLKMFKPGSLIHDGKKFQMISDPLRDLSQLFASLFSSVALISDKIRIMLLKNDLSNYSIDNDSTVDVSTFDYLRSRGFSDKFIELFFRPFFSGIFLENKLETSSKFFKYVFSNFSKGLAALPLNGMQKIPDLIKKNINKTSVTLNRCVESIKSDRRVVLDNGDEIIAENIVITANSHELIGSKSVQYSPVVNLYFSSKTFPKNGKYIYLFPKDDLINNIAVLNAVSPRYSSSSRYLLSISILGFNCDELLIKKIREKLANYFGGGKSSYNFLKSFIIKKATIKQDKNFFSNNSVTMQDGLIFTGQHKVNGSIEGAVISGLKAANYIVKSSKS